jgi:dienelactone hydrolase
MADVEEVLDAVRQRFEPESIVSVGYLNGGRVAARLCAGADVGAVVALTLIPAPTRLLVMHGTAGTWTDPHFAYSGSAG